jgi:phosphatidylserine/phosphatidylglycerophosphate/cardiolipin synthase-like enzyme
LTPDRLVTSVHDRRATLLDIIRHARNRITLSVFRFNDDHLLAELAAASARGVTIDALITSRAKGGRKPLGKLWRALVDAGVSVNTYTDPVAKYHPKYLVVDEGPAVVASLNFTRKCFRKTCDALVVTYDPAVVSGLRRLWTADRDRLPMPPI